MKASVKSSSPTSLHLSYDGAAIEVIATRLHESREKEVGGWLAISGMGKDMPHRLLIPTSFNFSSLQRRERTASTLNGRLNAVAWDELLEDACARVIEHWNHRNPAESWLDYDNEAEAARFLIEPFIIQNDINLIFGDGGSGKTNTALLLLILAALPFTDNPFRLNVTESPINCLLLDWETGPKRIRYRIKALLKGLDLPPTLSIHYQRCSHPLADNIEQTQELVASVKAQLVIIDSLGMAAGGDLNATQPALQFFGALRSLGDLSYLLLAHQAKNTEGRKTPFGCVYYWNEPRNIWELRGQTDYEQSYADVGLFHAKGNDIPKYMPVGFRFNFDRQNNIIRPELQDVRSVAEFVERLSLTDRIKEVLAQGALIPHEISVQLDIKEDLTRAMLHKLKGKNVVTKLSDGKWGLLSHAIA